MYQPAKKSFELKLVIVFILLNYLHNVQILLWIPSESFIYTFLSNMSEQVKHYITLLILSYMVRL